MKKIVFALLTLCISMFAFSQGELDALRMSTNDTQGTARGQAMGGAFGALGGDVTGIGINPAGIGVYRSSEVSTTIGLSYANWDSDWKGNKENESSTRFNFDNISYIGYFPTGNTKGVLSVNFGFSFNKLKDFNRKYTSVANKMGTSLTDYIATTTNGINYKVLNDDPYDTQGVSWLSSLGWHGMLIDTVPGYTDRYEPSLLQSGETVNSYLHNEEKGYIYSYDFSMGANINHNLFLGLTVSFLDIDYTLNSVYEESYEYGEGFFLDNRLETQGSGYQVKAGAIWRPHNALRLGVSYHSPTWYTLTDYYQGWAKLSSAPGGVSDTPERAFTNYKFHTPYSWTFSAAGIIGTKAILSLDYELKDYTSMNLQEENGRDYIPENDLIDEDFKLTSTLRVGAEYKIDPQFAVRAGFSYQESPYDSKIKNQVNFPEPVGTIPHYTIEKGTYQYSAGIGYRLTPQFYIDFAFIQQQQKSDLYYFSSLYSADDGSMIVKSEPAKLTKSMQRGLITLGYKF